MRKLKLIFVHASCEQISSYCSFLCANNILSSLSIRSRTELRIPASWKANTRNIGSLFFSSFFWLVKNLRTMEFAFVFENKLGLMFQENIEMSLVNAASRSVWAAQYHSLARILVQHRECGYVQYMRTGSVNSEHWPSLKKKNNVQKNKITNSKHKKEKSSKATTKKIKQTAIIRLKSKKTKRKFKRNKTKNFNRYYSVMHWFSIRIQGPRSLMNLH